MFRETDSSQETNFPMTHRKSLFAIFAIAVLGTAWCLAAAPKESGDVEIVETRIKFADCPLPIQKAIQAESVGAKLNDVVKATEADKSIFKADVTIDDRDYIILVAEDGTLIGKMLNEDDDGTTREVKFSDCPAPVQKTFRRESRGAKLETVYEVTENGKTEYVTGAKIEGKIYEIIVGEDGILISKLLDEEIEEERETEEKVRKT